jgi:hypothetical protein
MFDARKQKKTFFLFLVVGCWLVGCQRSGTPPLQGGFPRFPEGQGGDLSYQEIQEDPDYGWLYFDTTPSVTPSNTPSPSVTPPNTPSSSDTPPNTPSSSDTPSATSTQTAASTQTGTPASTPSASATPTASPSDTPLSCSWVYNSNNNFILDVTPSTSHFLIVNNNLMMTSDAGGGYFNANFYPTFPSAGSSNLNVIGTLMYQTSANSLLSSYNPQGVPGNFDQVITIESGAVGIAAYAANNGGNALYNCIGQNSCTDSNHNSINFLDTIVAGDTDASGNYWFFNPSGNLLVYFFDTSDPDAPIYITPAITVTDPITFAPFAEIPSQPIMVRIDKNPMSPNLYYTINNIIYQVAISGCTVSTGPCYGASPVSSTITGATSLANILFDDQYDVLALDPDVTPPVTYYVKASDMSYTPIQFASGGPTLTLFTQLVDLGGTVDRLQPNNVSPSPAPATLDPTYLFLYDLVGGTSIYYYQYSCQ